MSDRQNALAVREAIGAAHPEIMIKSPLTSRSGRWELMIDNGTTIYDNFWMMVDYLAERYDNEPEGDEDQPHPKDRYAEIQVKPG